MTAAITRGLAKLGAKVRLGQLREEEQNLYRAFPDLRARETRHTQGEPTTTHHVAHERPARAATPTRHRMSRAARQAVSKRMSAYWANRRRQNGAK